MEKALIIFSILTHDFNFMMVFCLIATMPTAIWHVWYFPNKNCFPERKLVEISQKFDGINSRYTASHFLWMLGLFVFMAICIKIDIAWIMPNFAVRFYPMAVGASASYGIFQGLFAINSGVYPMSRLLSYAYDDIAKIKRIAQYQISICIAAFIIMVVFFFITAR